MNTKEIKQFDFNGKTYSIEVRANGWNKRNKKTRAFVWLADEHQISTNLLETFAAGQELDSIYTAKGENKVMDKAWKNHNAQESALMQALLWCGLSEIEHDLGASEHFKPHFSRYAGCSCPCSPSFVIDGMYPNYTIYVQEVK